MEIRGRVVEINLNAEITKKDGGTYQGATISYRDKDNKLQEKAFHVNALKFNAALKNGLENLQASDNFVVQAEKNDGGFWEWKSIAKAGAEAPKQTQQAAPAKQAASSGGTWQTAEERAQTQKYIVRQSSITNALKLLELHGNKKATTRDVISLAQEFEAYVFNQAPKELTNLGDYKPTALADSSKANANAFDKNANPFEDIEDDVPL